MPFNPKKPPADLKKKIKKKYPKATAKQIRQFIHIFNTVYEETESEQKAFSQAWGVLKQNVKKSSIIEKLVKVATVCDENQLFDIAKVLDTICEKLSE
jgi:hypothetical protein